MSFKGMLDSTMGSIPEQHDFEPVSLQLYPGILPAAPEILSFRRNGFLFKVASAWHINLTRVIVRIWRPISARFV